MEIGSDIMAHNLYIIYNIYIYLSFLTTLKKIEFGSDPVAFYTLTGLFSQHKTGCFRGQAETNRSTWPKVIGPLEVKITNEAPQGLRMNLEGSYLMVRDSRGNASQKKR